MELRLYNTITRSKDVFTPIDKKLVRMYTCGPTVYNYAHIGNLRTYIFEDILKRVLFYNSFRVRHVMNITDVGHLTSDADTGEDKMEKGARREKKTVWEIAEFYTKAFRDDLKSLNIIEPDVWCRATEHIKQQIEQIRILEKKGFTYQIEDGIYFDTSRLKDYGKLARLDKEGLMAGARIEMVRGKRNPTDFALWKFSPKDKKRQMEWESPWGTGFPGWHIECSAMSMHYLGESFDIHCGGIDHIPVHHTNEIAQAEASTGKEWVRFWLHGEFLVLDQAKMAKSGENFITLNTLVEKGYEPLDYRYLCLTAHYRQQLGFSWAGLDTAKNSLNSLKNKIIDILDEKQSKPNRNIEENHKKQFLEAINDDLNMPRALAVLWETAHDDKIGSWDRYNLILDFDKVLGLKLEQVKRVDEIPGDIKVLLEERETARTNKDWKAADELRKRINAKGYLIDDTSEGQKLKKG